MEADGFDSFWLPQICGVDALCAHTFIGSQVPRIELGTAVVPTYPVTRRCSPPRRSPSRP